MGHQVQNLFFALIKKIFLQTLVEIIYIYHYFLQILGTPWNLHTNKKKKNDNFTYYGVLSKLGKNGAGSLFLEEFLFFRPFSSTLQAEKNQKILTVAYVHIKYSSNQFSGESNPPPVLTVPKKAWS